MDTMQAWAMKQMALAVDAPNRVFDWKKAVEIIKEYNIKNASAGLERDWEWTGGRILRDGKIVDKDDTYTFLLSCWATPLLRDDDTDEEYECWSYSQDSEYVADTYWPEDALELLNQ